MRPEDNIPEFNGETGEAYVKYRAHLVWIHASLKVEDQNRFAPAVIERFVGEPELAYRQR